MKIGFVFDDGLDATDGVQQNILTLGKWLEENGHEVHYLVGETKRTDLPTLHSLAKNIRVQFNGNTLTVPLPTSKRKITWLLDELKLDVLHVQTPYSPFLGGRVLRLGHAKSVVISTFHIMANSRFVDVANHVLGVINRPTRKYIDLHVAVSEPAAMFAQRAYGYSCQVLANPFELDRFLVKNEATESDQEVQIVFLGRLVNRKGARHLLEAVAHLRKSSPGLPAFRVHIGGKGVQREELEQFVSERHLQEIVHFHGFVAEEDKVAFLAQADIAVFPSTSGESFGISLLEGMASARGVVLAGNNPGYASVMARSWSDQLFDPKNTAEFAHVLEKYIRSPKERALAAKRQKKHTRQFDVRVVGPKLLNLYEAALKKRKNAP